MRIRSLIVFIILSIAIPLSGCGNESKNTGLGNSTKRAKVSEVSLRAHKPSGPAHITALKLLTATEIKSPQANRVVLTFSALLSPHSVLASFTPKIAGEWRINGNQEIFTAGGNFVPCSSYTAKIAEQTSATGGTGGQEIKLAHSIYKPIYIPCPTTLSLQGVLTQLGYTPYQFRPLNISQQALASGANQEQISGISKKQIVSHQNGAPKMHISVFDTVTKAAVMSFQADYGLPVDGIAGSQTWRALISSLGKRRQHLYTWVDVSEKYPENLQIHRGNHVELSSLANTGVAGAATATGIFPIYSRFISTSMSGTFPDGSHYTDPNIPWVNYFNGGDAVHGYQRAGYGFPQSNGCVELPPQEAQKAFALLSLGDLVVVR